MSPARPFVAISWRSPVRFIGQPSGVIPVVSQGSSQGSRPSQVRRGVL